MISAQNNDNGRRFCCEPQQTTEGQQVQAAGSAGLAANTHRRHSPSNILRHRQDL